MGSPEAIFWIESDHSFFRADTVIRFDAEATTNGFELSAITDKEKFRLGQIYSSEKDARTVLKYMLAELSELSRAHSTAPSFTAHFLVSFPAGGKPEARLMMYDGLTEPFPDLFSGSSKRRNF